MAWGPRLQLGAPAYRKLATRGPTRRPSTVGPSSGHRSGMPLSNELCGNYFGDQGLLDFVRGQSVHGRATRCSSRLVNLRFTEPFARP
jgi:hypothetical protein